MADVGQRVVMEVRNELFRHLLDQSAAFFARRTLGAAAVAHHQRRRPGAAGRVGDDRRSAPRVARRCWARRRCCSVYDAKLALVCMTGAPLVVYPLVRLGQRVRADDAAEPGSARAPVARRRRGLHRPPHCQGVRRGRPRGARNSRAPRSRSIRTNMKVTRRPVDAAAHHGVARRPRHRRRAVVRQPARSQRAS